MAAAQPDGGQQSRRIGRFGRKEALARGLPDGAGLNRFPGRERTQRSAHLLERGAAIAA